MPLRIDSTKAIRRPADLVTFAEAILGADQSDELDWIEWKSRLDLNDRQTKFTLARNILGMSNRNHEHAIHNAGGCGYIFIGVEPGNLPGIIPVDPAKLDTSIRKYAGDGPQWSPQYLEVRDNKVLAIVVEPPRLGDEIHTLQSGFETFEAGCIFVRRSGLTHRANPTEVAYLTRRAAGSTTAVSLSVTFGQDPIFAINVCSVDRAIADAIQSQRTQLVDGIISTRKKVVSRARQESEGSPPSKPGSTEQYSR